MNAIMIAGPRTGVGKTTVTLGLLAGLSGRGLNVQAYKVGPDYIDLGLHAALTRRPCYNLDGWMMPGDDLVRTYLRAASARTVSGRQIAGADLAVVEGMMGLFDGVGSADSGSSSADIAMRLGVPVLMVLDVNAMAGSAGAAALGYREYEPELDLRGVILNRVAGEHHGLACQEALDRVDIPVFGAVPIDENVRMRERHLGLMPAWERAQPAASLDDMAQTVAAHLDLDAILQIAASAEPLDWPAGEEERAGANGGGAGAGPNVRIGVARDQAFGFYYQDTLDMLTAAGAELVIFSPLRDDALPAGLGGLYLGGGFPEAHLDALEANVSLRDAVRERAAAGMPIYAECGGLMYLCRSIAFGDRPRAMVGVLGGHVRMGGRQAVAYVEIDVVRDTPLVAAGTPLRGHVFHNSVIEDIDEGEAQFAYQLKPGPGIVDQLDGWMVRNVLASYTHLPLAAHPELIHRWLDRCRAFHKSRARDA